MHTPLYRGKNEYPGGDRHRGTGNEKDYAGPEVARFFCASLCETDSFTFSPSTPCTRFSGNQ